MLKSLIVVVLGCLIFSACNEKEAETAGADAQLMRLNKLYDSAILRQDTAILKKLYSDDFVYTSPEGRLLNKEQQLVSVIASELKWDSTGSEDVKIRFYGNVAVMTGGFKARGTYRGNPLSINERYTAVWVKKDTSWQVVAEQGSIVQ